MRLFKSLLAAAAIALLALSGAAFAQSGRTIRIVVPFPAGGSADIWARILGDQVSKAHGVNVIIENRAGGGTVIATDFVSRANPDGNTVLVIGNSFTINPAIRKLNYDPVTSFEPVCYMLNSPQLIAINSASPYRTLADLVAAAKAKPGELTMGVNAPATAQHLTGEMFKHVAGIDMTYVPFPGGLPAVNAMLGGHVASVVANYSELIEQMNAGKVRALAATGGKRISLLPEVLTVAESGYPGFDMDVWFGLMVPAKTPADKVTEIADWFTAAMHVPEAPEKLQTLMMFPVGTCGAPFAAHLKKQLEENARVVREANIKAD
jgi:tripartite-type tricarboxylate transporter receptor subunit TctC